jgi:Tol biopolymer transport system component
VTRLVAVTLAAVALLVVAVSAPAHTARAGGGYWIVLASDRDGQTRAYSVRPNGSRLTPLFASGSAQDPVAISADGTTIAYDDNLEGGTGLSISRANGTKLRRLELHAVGTPALSRDGKLLAFLQGFPSHIEIVRTDGTGLRRLTSSDGDDLDLSPDGKALAFLRISTDQRHEALVIQPLHGRERVLVRASIPPGLGEPRWSSDGRWIAYEANGLWVVHPNGTDRHQVARGDVYPLAWSPDGKRLAYAFGYPKDLAVVGVDGHDAKRLHVRPLPNIFGLSWSPDGSRLAFQAGDTGPSQIWVIGDDGRGLRRVASGGANTLVGWTPLAPVRPSATPLLPSERVLDTRTVETRTPVTALSADGARAAVIVGRTAADCDHVVVWTPAAHALDRFRPPTPCGDEGHGTGPSIYDVTLAGSRAVWASFSGCGNFCDFVLTSATLGRRSPVALASTSADGSGAGVDYHVYGAGDLLVFNDESRLARIGVGRGACQENRGPTSGICSTLRRGADAAPVESVSGGLIAIHEPDAVKVLDAQGKLIQTFPFGTGEVDAARLDGERLVVARSGVLEVYDVPTGAGSLQRPLPAGYQLTDVNGGIAVLRKKDTIRLLRLTDGRSFELTPGAGPVFADLEQPGLYYSYATGHGDGRLVFVPRSELLRRLG